MNNKFKQIVAKITTGILAVTSLLGVITPITVKADDLPADYRPMSFYEEHCSDVSWSDTLHKTYVIDELDKDLKDVINYFDVDVNGDGLLDLSELDYLTALAKRGAGWNTLNGGNNGCISLTDPIWLYVEKGNPINYNNIGGRPLDITPLMYELQGKSYASDFPIAYDSNNDGVLDKYRVLYTNNTEDADDFSNYVYSYVMDNIYTYSLTTLVKNTQRLTTKQPNSISVFNLTPYEVIEVYDDTKTNLPPVIDCANKKIYIYPPQGYPERGTYLNNYPVCQFNQKYIIVPISPFETNIPALTFSTYTITTTNKYVNTEFGADTTHSQLIDAYNAYISEYSLTESVSGSFVKVPGPVTLTYVLRDGDEEGTTTTYPTNFEKRGSTTVGNDITEPVLNEDWFLDGYYVDGVKYTKEELSNLTITEDTTVEVRIFPDKVGNTLPNDPSNPDNGIDNPDGIDDRIEHIVTFVNDDDEVINKQVVPDKGDATAPNDPTSNITPDTPFSGWDKPYTNVTEDITVKAQYGTIPATPGNASPSDSIEVSFEIIGTLPNGVKVPSSITIERGEGITPNTLYASGYTFDGWYLDKELTIKYHPGDILEEDTVLYASFIKKHISGDSSGNTGSSSHSSSDSNNGPGVAVSETVPEPTPVVEPITTPAPAELTSVPKTGEQTTPITMCLLFAGLSFVTAAVLYKKKKLA